MSFVKIGNRSREGEDVLCFYEAVFIVGTMSAKC